MLDESQIQRYARQLALKDWSAKAQERLLNAHALVVGAGGLGSPVAYYLAAAGVGHITIIDSDVIELSNLNRQILFSTGDIGRPKAQVAKEKLDALNPSCRVEPLSIRLTPHNSLEYFGKADIILDCTDGFPSKYLMNDAAALSGKPLVYAGVLGFSGQVMLIRPGESACLRCLFPEPPPLGTVPTCVEAGIMGTVAASIGLVQATEAIKQIAGIGVPLVNRMLTFEALDMRWLEVKVSRNPKCPICGESPSIKKLEETLPACESPK